MLDALMFGHERIKELCAFEEEVIKAVGKEKMEVVCDVDNVKKVISKLREVHPYEEPAIDIIPLLDEDSFE